MNRHRIAVAALLCSAALLATGVSPALFYPRENTRKAVKTYVEQAAAIVQKSGPSCDTFAGGAWRTADYYIFVVGPDGRLVCHARADMIGKLSADIVNKSGDRVGEKIVKMGAGNDQGWVDYLWPRTDEGPEERKSSYVMGVTGPDHKHYVVGAGAFGLSK